MIKIVLISGGAPNGKGIFPADFIGVYFNWKKGKGFGRTSGKDNDMVCQCDCLGEIVCDEECGFSGFADNICDVCGDEEPGLKIQSAEGFVEKEEIRVNRHGANQRGALPHTAGKLGGFFIFEAVEAVIFQKL